MLNDHQILADLHSLPPEKQLKVLQYIHRLKETPPAEQHEKNLRPFGVIPGKSWMSEDFDAPLEDFSDYMPSGICYSN